MDFKRDPTLIRIPLDDPKWKYIERGGDGLPYFERRFLWDLKVAFGRTAVFDLFGYPKKNINI